MQSPHFRIEVTEVKRQINDLSEFIHLVNDRAKSGTQAPGSSPIVPSSNVQPGWYSHNVLILVFCDVRVRHTGR